MLNVSDKEIEFFKGDVEKFNEIDSQIQDIKKKMKPFQDKIKELTKLKKEKQSEVLSFMESNDLDVCNVGDSSFEVKKTTSTKQLTRGDVYDRLYKFFSEDEKSLSGTTEEKAKLLHDYIYVEGREKTEGKTLKAK